MSGKNLILSPLWAFLILSAAILTSACQKELPVECEDIITSFTASFDDEITSKATADMTSGKVSWENGDVIRVTNGTDTADYTYDSSTHKFHNETGLAKKDAFYAVYPASIVSGVSGGSFTVSLPSSQEYAANLVKQAPMSGYTTGYELKFKNLCGILKFQITGEHNVKNIKFTAGGDKCVAGTATVNAAEGTLSVSSGQSQTLELSATSVQLSTATPFYMVVPAQTYTSGFSIKVTSVEGPVFDKSSSKPLQIVASQIDAMKAFEATLFSGGIGTSSNPYKISKAQDIKDLVTFTNGSDFEYFRSAYYKQTANIDMGGATINPICRTQAKGLSGRYDGNDKKISGVTVVNAGGTDEKATGLFGYVNGGTVKNLGLDGRTNAVTVKSSDSGDGTGNVGAFAGRLVNGGTLSGLEAWKVTVSGKGNNVGGIVGIVYSTSNKVDDCHLYLNCSVSSSTGLRVGGIVGHIDGSASGCASKPSTVSNCECKSSIISAARRVGGIAGVAEGGFIINKCKSGAILTATYETEDEDNGGRAGGIVGSMNQTKTSGHIGLVINCVYGLDMSGQGGTITTKIKAATINTRAGGIVGAIESCSSGTSTMKVVNCFALPAYLNNEGASTTDGSAGIVGYFNCKKTHIINCYSPVDISRFRINGTPLDLSVFNDDNYRIGSIVGTPTRDIVLNFAFGQSQLPLFGAVPTNKTFSNYSNTATDPVMKNYAPVSYSSSYTVTATQTSNLQAALNEGASVYNAAPDFSGVTAVEWEVDEKMDGYLKPKGVYPKLSGTAPKKISIIGDSISTFKDFILSDYSAHYPNSNNDLCSVQQTWWHQLIYDKMQNARLDMCNAYGGTAVAYFDSSTAIYTDYKDQPGYETLASPDKGSMAQSFVERYKTVGVGHPDILFIYGGRNDFSKYGKQLLINVGKSNERDIYCGASTESFLNARWTNGFKATADKSGYNNGYTSALMALVATICYNYSPTDSSKWPKFVIVLHDMTSDSFDDGSQAVADRLTAKGVKVKFVSLHEKGTRNQTNTIIGIDKPSNDGSHPNKTGAANVANYIYNQIGSWLDE